MRTRPSSTGARSTLLAGIVALVGACTDAPTAPPAATPRLLSANPHAAHGADVAPALSVGLSLVAPVFADISALGGWMETFNVNPDDRTTWVKPPAPWLPTSPSTLPNAPLGSWAISKHSRDLATWDDFEDMSAWHEGTTCNAPPLSHLVADYDRSTYFCRNHMMTAMNATGYGIIYLTPNRMVDWAAGEAVVRFDVASKRESGRDWLDLWIMPFDENLAVPLDDSLPDLNGGPRNGFHLRMRADRANSSWTASFLYDGEETALPVASTAGAEAAFTAAGLTTSATRRDTFELRLSRNRLRFGMPRYDLWWIDTSVPTISWTRGVVQFGHHSFAPKSDCAGCLPTTWHWDNIGMAPAVPFTIINADRRTVDAANTTLRFQRAAPDQSFLRFSGYPGMDARFEISVDGGRRWNDAKRQTATRANPARFQSYWTPVARGTTEVLFRTKAGGLKDDDRPTTPGPARWMVRDATIWSRNP